MNEYTGWLLDMYMDAERGVVLWFLCEDGKRRCLHQSFPVTFYAAGPAHRLHELCQYLKKELPSIRLSRDERRDIFFGPTVVLAAQLDSPFVLAGMYRRIAEVFPDIILYDVDLDIPLRHAAVHGTFPLARCQVISDEEKNICELNVIDSRWDIDPEPPPLRILKIEPDVHPFHSQPQKILIHTPKATMRLDIHDPSSLALFNYILKQDDPDLILSSHGDTWILPMLLEWAEKENRPLLLNRDTRGEITFKKERSYFAYGQVVYRGRQVRLAGRLHVDRGDMVMGDDYGFEGVLELARVSSLPIQTAARVSPGTGISSMEVITALQQGILVPLLKEQIENEKTTSELLEAEKGGIIGDPEIGLHENVAELDFAAMYGSLVVRFNISPETVNTGRPTEKTIPGLGLSVDQERPGLIPMTLAPLLVKRAELKRQLRTLSRLDCRYEPYKSRASAHKWLVVTCIGYLGFKSARFGCITTHEVILARSRDVMLCAQEAVEDLGYRVLHRYVDGIWIKKPGCSTPQDFQPAIDEIIRRTGLSILLEGVYNWIAFPHSRQSKRVAVPNRYFGVFRSGEIKTRGIETRRHDSPEYISETQMEILAILAKAPSLDHFAEYLPEIENLVQRKLTDLRSGRVPPEKLIVNLSVSRELEEFKTPSPVASALQQLASEGKTLRPGQRIRLVYILGKARACAWDIPVPFDPRTLNLPRYEELFLRAVSTILEPMKEYYAYHQGQMPEFFEKQPILAGLESWIKN
jgi:DNA polymerase II